MTDTGNREVPREQAGTAGGALITAQRLGAAIGIAVIGTALFGSSGGSGGSGGSGSGSGGRPGMVVPMLVPHAQAATLVNLGFVLAALLCTFGLPKTLGGGGEEPRHEEPAAADASAEEAPAQR